MEKANNQVSNQAFCEKISAEQLHTDLIQKLPLDFLKNQQAIPIVHPGPTGRVVIALADPLNVEAYDAIVNILSTLPEINAGQWSFEHPCPRIICPAQEIENAISHCYYQDTQETKSQPLSETVDDTLEETLNLNGPAEAEDLLNIGDKAPAIKLVNTILFQAVKSRASDIHIEPYEDETRVRLRVDGVLHDVMCIEKRQLAAVQSRVKIMANLNIAERRLPQDGQARVKIGDDQVDIRVSVIPTMGGERIVLRLLDKGQGQLSLGEIGLDHETLETIRQLIKVPHGIVLLTGPTGSGKTTTLYAALNELNAQDKNILTVEDPVEYQLRGIGQMQVKPKIGLSFASGLRHILRQDPDIIMIGEIRDLETAQIAIQASMTGHLVLSTLHTNDSASAVTRLLDMGIEPYLIASTLNAVIAQRLVREICPECKTFDGDGQSHTLMSSFNNLPGPVINNPSIYCGTGCQHCLHTGYRGRTGLFELMLMDDAIRNLVIKQSPAHEIQDQAMNRGMVTLRQDGLQKVYQGQTTIDEVCRVTQSSILEEIGV